MKRYFSIITVLILFSCLPTNAFALDIIPDLRGFGTATRAAYGAANNPVIFMVTDLTTDDGMPGDSIRNGVAVKTGSFLEAVNYNPPADTGKIIIFEVSGTIGGASCTRYRISNPYTSILGQTAPSPGILLKNSMVQVRVSDILIQHVRIRSVPEGAIANKWEPLFIGSHPDSGYYTVENIVADHLSVSWGRDETGHIGCQGASTVGNITVSNSIFSEGLKIDTNKGKGFLVWGSTCQSQNLAFIGNLFASNSIRNPLIKHPSAVVVNNLVYNAENFPGVISTEENCNEPGNFSIVGNVVKGGPWSCVGTSQQIVALRDLYNSGTGTNIFLNDNQCGDGAGGIWTQSSWNDWWDGATRRVWMKKNWEWFDYETPTKVASAPIWPSGLSAMVSADVEASVVANVGARPVDRDSVDSRLINEVNTGAGISAAKTSVAPGDWPTLAENTDTHNDLPSNPHADNDGDGYTNLEEWLHDYAAIVEGNLTIRDAMPTNGATGISITTDLNWTNPTGATNIDLLFDKKTAHDPPTTKIIDDLDVETY